MKLEITATEKVIDVHGILCRLWEGRTENGIPCKVFVHRVAVHESQDQAAFQRELQEMPAPQPNVFRLRDVL